MRDLALLIKCKTHKNSILKNKKLALLFINLYSFYIYKLFYIAFLLINSFIIYLLSMYASETKALNSDCQLK